MELNSQDIDGYDAIGSETYRSEDDGGEKNSMCIGSGREEFDMDRNLDVAERTRNMILRGRSGRSRSESVGSE
jgi:hypothetical protein